MSYDLNLLGDPDSLSPDLAVGNTRIDGIMALVQRVMILFFTDEDAPASLGIGCTFAQFVQQSGNNPSQDALQNNVNIATSTIRSQLLGDQNTDLPDDQQLADLSGIIERSERDAAYIVLDIVSKAGSSYKLRYPVTGG